METKVVKNKDLEKMYRAFTTTMSLHNQNMKSLDELEGQKHAYFVNKNKKYLVQKLNILHKERMRLRNQLRDELTPSFIASENLIYDKYAEKTEDGKIQYLPDGNRNISKANFEKANLESIELIESFPEDLKNFEKFKNNMNDLDELDVELSIFKISISNLSEQITQKHIELIEDFIIE